MGWGQALAEALGARNHPALLQIRRNGLAPDEAQALW